MSPLTLDTALVVSEDVVTQELEGEMVLLSLDRAEYFGLNATGTVVWNGLVSGRGLREIASVIVEQFTVDAERATADVLTLAQQLIDAGLASPRTA
jgi:hypothetical protein